MNRIRRDWGLMREAVRVEEAAARFGWSQLAVWMLIRQRKVKWAIRGSKTVVDMKEMYAWKNKNIITAEALTGTVGAEQKHPITIRNERK